MVAEQGVAGNSRHQDRLLRIDKTGIGLLEQGFAGLVLDTSEIHPDALPGGGGGQVVVAIIFEQAHLRGELLLLRLVQRLPAFGDHDDIGLPEAFAQIAQAPQREQQVRVYGTVEIDEDNVQVGAQAAVLEGIVEHDIVRRGHVLRVRMAEAPASVDTVRIDGHAHDGEFFLDLDRLVAAKEGAAVQFHFRKTAALAPVPPRQHGDIAHRPFVGIEQQAQNQLHVRGFARAAGGDIAHADRRHLGAFDAHLPRVIAAMAPFQRQPVREKEDRIKHSGCKYNQKSRRVPPSIASSPFLCASP